MFVLNVILQLATRTEAAGPRDRPGSRRQPALALEAAAGSGRTTVLTTAAGWLAGSTPLVLIDLGRCTEADAGAVLAAVAEELTRPWGGYRGLSFPRFRQLLSEHRPGASLSNHAAPASPAVLRREPRGGVARLRGWIAQRVMPDATAREDPPPAAFPAEQLESLCDAFLADLTDVYANGRRADEWTRNCVLLADNADNPTARLLLHTLVEARAARLRRTPPLLDPLTVVAASRGDLLAGPTPSDIDIETVDPGAVRQQIGTVTGWLRHRLPDLTEAEIGDLVTGPAHIRRQVRTLTHRLTGGHARATHRVLARMTVDRQAAVSPASVLDDLAGPLLTELVGDLPRDRPDAVALAAARHAEHAPWLRDEGVVGGDPSFILPPAARIAMWNDTATPTLLRRLLLRQLAGTDTSIAPRWTDAYVALAGRAAKFEPEAEPYYRLATGTPDEIEQVVARLTAQLTLPEPDWVDLVESVAQAPCPLRAAQPHQRWTSALALYRPRVVDGREAVVAGRVWRVLAGLWLLADPATGVHRRDIHHKVANAFDELAADVDGDGELVRTRAREHLEETKSWE